MYMLRNRVQIIGNVVRRPELKTTTKSGRTYTRFCIATHEDYRKPDGKKVQDTQFHNIQAWGKMAKLACIKLDKGGEVAVQGKLTSRSYVDKNGIKRYVTEIVINDLLLLNRSHSMPKRKYTIPEGFETTPAAETLLIPLNDEDERDGAVHL